MFDKKFHFDSSGQIHDEVFSNTLLSVSCVGSFVDILDSYLDSLKSFHSDLFDFLLDLYTDLNNGVDVSDSDWRQTVIARSSDLVTRLRLFYNDDAPSLVLKNFEHFQIYFATEQSMREHWGPAPSSIPLASCQYSESELLPRVRAALATARLSHSKAASS